MKLFSFGKRPQAPTVQTCTAADRGIIPQLRSAQNCAELKLYKQLRENVPVIDAAVMKLVRLLGSFSVVCADSSAQDALDSFVSGVKVSGTGTGLYSFVCSYFDQLLTYGIAVGEIVTYDDGTVAALYNAPADAVELRHGDNPVDVRIFVRDIGQPREAEHPELIAVSLLNPEPGKLRGTSLMKGLPFVSDILMKIFDCVGQNFERAGNVRFV